MAVYYEWDAEETDADGDILDHRHGDTLAELLPLRPGETLVLVRDDPRGRSWAYVENHQLPEYFRDAFDNLRSKVPARFHHELLANQRTDS